MRGSWRPNKDCNILNPPPTLLAITAFLSRSPGLLDRGSGGPATAGTWFSFQHLLSNCLNFLSPGLYNNLTSTYFLRTSQFHSQFNPSTVKVALDLLISSTGCTSYLHRCISSFDSLAGSEANMQQFLEVDLLTTEEISFSPEDISGRTFNDWRIQYCSWRIQYSPEEFNIPPEHISGCLQRQ